MKRAILLATISACVIQWTVNPRSGIGETETPNSHSLRAIAMDVFIVRTQGDSTEEYTAGLAGASDEVAARLRELQSNGRAVSVHRIRLTALEGQKVLIQLGKDAPVATGRTYRGPGGPSQTAYQQRSFGTLVSGTATVEGDEIIIELQVERSDLDRSPDDSQTEDRLVPPATESFTSQTTVRIRSGHTIVVSGMEETTGEDSTAQLVLASARFLDAPSQKAAGQQTQSETTLMKIFALENASADAAATMIRELAIEESAPLRVSVDSRTNSLIVTGRKPELMFIEAILLRLDSSETRGGSEESNGAKPSGFGPASTKYDEMDKQQLQDELKRLQKEVLVAARTARQAVDKLSEATRSHKTAQDDEIADALLRRIEADAARHEPDERYKRVRSDLRAAEKAYYRLLIAE